MSGIINIGVVGCGFWAYYQARAWMEIPEVKIAAVCDEDKTKATGLAKMLGVDRVHSDVDAMLTESPCDFVDVVSSPESHAEIVFKVADKGIPVVCQKPMAPNLETAVKMVGYCQVRHVPFYIHENFRWQAPMVRIKQLLDGGEIGVPFKARIFFNTRFPVLKNQPALATMERMIIADLGVHLFDLVRFFFGEAKSVFCKTSRVEQNIKGEDVANAFIETRSGVQCLVELSWASYVEEESFPQTLVSIDGSKGSITLAKDCRITLVGPERIEKMIVPIPRYSWVNPDYEIVHSSLVACNNDLLNAITGRGESHNRADKNLETLKLVYAAYESAGSGEAVNLNTPDYAY